ARRAGHVAKTTPNKGARRGANASAARAPAGLAMLRIAGAVRQQPNKAPQKTTKTGCVSQ
ncbi:MAG: hypothetical protein K2K83_04140, partial [Rikenella sp.]|nr:hypothetical protein [Rikenella sp.]